MLLVSILTINAQEYSKEYVGMFLSGQLNKHLDGYINPKENASVDELTAIIINLPKYYDFDYFRIMLNRFIDGYSDVNFDSIIGWSVQETESGVDFIYNMITFSGYKMKYSYTIAFASFGENSICVFSW